MRLRPVMPRPRRGVSPALAAVPTRIGEWCSTLTTPLIEADPNAPDGSTVLATFVYFDADADWVYLDANGLTDRDWFTDGLLAPLGESGWWSITLRVDTRWRGAYGFISGSQPSGPPSGDAGARRAWWVGLVAHTRPDPRNPAPTHHQPLGGELSEAAMPGAPAQPWVPGPPEGLHRHTLDLNGVRRDVWTLTTGPHGTRRLAIAFDGRTWAERIPIAASIMAASASGALGPLALVLVDAVSPDLRARELTCSPEFRTAVADRLVPWARAELGAVADRDSTVAVGQSFGGLAAVDLVLERPDVFGAAISQSGSFWWNGDDADEQRWIWDDRLRVADRSGSRLWLEAGTLEGDMQALTERFAGAARMAGVAVAQREFCGGHDVVQWRDGFVTGLIALLS